MFRKCVCVAAVCLTLAIAGGAGAQQSGVLFEYFDNIGSGTVVSDLTSHPNYPDKPTVSEIKDVFQSTAGRADNYGCRARAYLTPPETGDYTFWVAGDDYCQLWLSTDDTAAKAKMIAQVPGWTGVAEWGKYAEQKSAPVSLVAGQMYYIEALMKEGGGGDSLDVGWAGPGIGDATVAIAGQYCTAFVRLQARAPSPADGAVDVTSPLFEWIVGDTASSYLVYFGTTPELTAADNKGMWANMYYHADTMEPGATYYWRVDGMEATGAIITGKVWSFTVMPVAANAPYPADGVVNAPLDLALSWKAGQGAMTHDVYFGTDQDAVAAGDPNFLVGTVAETQYPLTALDLATTYFWRVDELDGAVGLVEGEVWSFTTVDLVEPAGEPNLVGWWTFDTEPANSMMALDMTGNGRHGLLVGDGLAFVTTPYMGSVLKLPGGNGKYVSVGAVGISGNDPTTIACWAKADHTSIPDWTLVFGFTGTEAGEGGNGSHLNIGSLGGPGGVGAHCWGWEETIFTDQEALEWHHYAVTYDGTTIQYYGDGVAMDTDPAKSNVQDLAIRGDRVHIGKRRTQESSFPGLVDDCRVYNRVLTAEEIAEIGGPARADVTAPGDTVQGIPTGLPCGGNPATNYTPCGELPPMVIDNLSTTKYLNFGGNFDPGESASGFQVAPSAGKSVVTGLTFTTANDAAERDPTAFELYGSNESIDGPYELIASGDIVDFAQAAEWPRFTMNATPILFENKTAYKFYQILFTAIRNPATANSMQIAEVEFLGVVVPVPVLFAEDFESYEAGSALHGQGGWKGWGGDAGAGAPASDAYAFSGTNSVEIISSADLVHEFDFAGGVVELSAMQYIPSGSTGETFFILLNQYDDPGETNDWSVQMKFNLGTGVMTAEAEGGNATATIIYDEWVELKFVIDLDANTCDWSYGSETGSHQWDNDAHGTLQAIDLYSASASSVWYDDIVIK